ncbi:MAG: hypothetical protein ACC628_05835 [Pirellulaceae bacterium]
MASDYLGPTALVASPDRSMLYVACADARQILFVELPAGSIRRRMDMPARPTDVQLTPDGSKLIVTCGAAESTIVVMDAGTGHTLAAIPAGHTAMGSALAPDGSRLYVCNRFDNDVSVIDLSAGREIGRIAAVREPIAAAVTCDGRTVVVANHLPNMRTNGGLLDSVAAVVTIIDTGSRETAEVELLSGAHALRDIGVSHDGRHAFVTHLMANFQMVPFRVDMGWINTNVVSVIDTRERKLLSTIGLDEFHQGCGNPWGLVGAGDGEWVCVSQAGTHELSVIKTSELLSDLAKRTMSPMMGVWPIYPGLGETLWRRIKLAGNGPRGLAAVGSTVYVAEYFSDTVSVVDLANLDDEPVRSIALGPPPNLTLERRGEMLFHDATICYQRWQSCSSCHPDGRGDALSWDLMNDGVANPKNTKSMLLSHRTPPVMARGTRDSAEEAVRAGLAGILFVNRPEEEAVAIDAYLDSLQPVPSPYRVDGQLSAAAERGRERFHSQRVACHRCHPAPRYTDLKSHNVGTRTTHELNDRYDTPTLVEVWRSAPYLHDGRYTTLRELLVEGKHGLDRSRSEELNDEELNDLVEFVLSL